MKWNQKRVSGIRVLEHYRPKNRRKQKLLGFYLVCWNLKIREKGLKGMKLVVGKI